MTPTLWVAMWGAGLSTLIGAVQLYDRFIRRPVPHISYCFRTLAEEGNEIILANGSDRPLMVDHWTLFWAVPKGIFGLNPTSVVVSYPDDDGLGGQMILAPHTFKNLSFVDEHHFGWQRINYRERLYLRLNIVGRKADVEFLVYESWKVTGWERKGGNLRRLLPNRLKRVTRPDL